MLAKMVLSQAGDHKVVALVNQYQFGMVCVCVGYVAEKSMLRIGKMADYGLLIMNVLGSSPTHLLGMEYLCRETGLSLPTVRKLMRHLVSAGLVKSIRGAKGGYQLARLPELISVAQILAAVEGPVAITECCDDDASCELSGGCNMESHWGAINHLIIGLLGAISLADLKRQQQGPNLDLPAVLQRLLNANFTDAVLCG